VVMSWLFIAIESADPEQGDSRTFPMFGSLKGLALRYAPICETDQPTSGMASAARLPGLNSCDRGTRFHTRSQTKVDREWTM
jgi:hypothetical protein